MEALVGNQGTKTGGSPGLKPHFFCFVAEMMLHMYASIIYTLQPRFVTANVTQPMGDGGTWDTPS